MCTEQVDETLVIPACRAMCLQVKVLPLVLNTYTFCLLVDASPNSFAFRSYRYCVVQWLAHLEFKLGDPGSIPGSCHDSIG